MTRPSISEAKILSQKEAVENIRKKVPTLYKYRPWQTDYQKSALLAPEIYFSAPSQVNDPFDIKLAYSWDLNEVNDPRFLEKLRKQFPNITRLSPGTRDYEVALSNFFENVTKLNPQKWFQQNQQFVRRSNIYETIGLFCATTDR
jgi:hypothetical protein